MSGNRYKSRAGLTIIEVMAATVMSTIVIFGVALLLADSQKGWNNTYNRVYSQVVSDSYAAQKAFESVIRRGSKDALTLGLDGDLVEVEYYKTDASTTPNGYARFTFSPGDEGGTLELEYGDVNPRQTTSTETICEDVESCVFTQAGASVLMNLTLDNGSQSINVLACAVLSNE